VNERPTRRLSQAIAEGDNISVLARVDGPADAESAARAGADAVVVHGGVDAVRAACDLPMLCLDERAAGADAYVLRSSGADADLQQRYYDVVDRGDECVVQVHDEEELERVLELLDPEILLLVGSEENGERVDHVLELLPDVPAGKLVIADAGSKSGDDVAGLERVGVDAVIVAAHDVQSLVGDEPPAV
jgi:indole-3-glycerol phosphate synthase